jgi:hypothetical protein
VPLFEVKAPLDIADSRDGRSSTRHRQFARWCADAGSQPWSQSAGRAASPGSTQASLLTGANEQRPVLYAIDQRSMLGPQSDSQNTMSGVRRRRDRRTSMGSAVVPAGQKSDEAIIACGSANRAHGRTRLTIKINKKVVSKSPGTHRSIGPRYAPLTARAR